MTAPKILASDAHARQLGLALFAAGFVLLMQGYSHKKPPKLLRLFHPMAGPE
jgi:hypothetical protein